MKLQKLCFALAVLITMIALGPASAIAATCTNASFTGIWGYQVGASVGQFTVDGNGHLTAGSQTVSQNGVIQSQTFTGTYSVSANCTGSITVNFTGGGSQNANFVLFQTNQGAQIVDTSNNLVAGGAAFAQGVACGLTGKKTFAANLFGKIVGTGPIQYVAQLILDGHGKVSGAGTFVVNGVVLNAPIITGTYTTNSNCTGTMKITPSGFSTLNFNFVAASVGKRVGLIETDANTVVVGNMQQ